MKKRVNFIIGILCSMCIVTAGTNCIDVSATTVGDVIAYARSIGMPEDMVQQYISMYSGGTYTSEQCDKAIAILAANKGQFSTPQQTEAPVTEKPVIYSDLNNEEKKEYIAELPADKREDVISNLSDNEKAELVENIAKNENAELIDNQKKDEILAEIAGVEVSEGNNIYVDNISDDAVMVVVRDEEGNVVNSTNFGSAVEKTGRSRKIPLAAGGGMILLSTVGIIAFLKKINF